MKTKKSSGYDGISNMFLKNCVKAVSMPFTYICNFSPTNGILLDRSKYALALPVYKGAKELIGLTIDPYPYYYHCLKCWKQFIIYL